jgi:glucose-6-phosphate isomerase
MLLFDELTPFAVGYLISIYEHKIFSQGVLWNLFSFDQWGVELGKELAQRILTVLDGGGNEGFDSSTSALIERVKSTS